MKKLFALALAAIAFPATADFQPSWASCNFAVDPAGRVTGFCSTGPVPTPTPTPTPTPPPTPTPTPPPPPTPTPGTCAALPSNAVMQTMFIGGTNNYVFDDRNYRNASGSYPPLGSQPSGTIQVFPIPVTANQAVVQLASFIYYNQTGAQYEVAFSKCPGDFTYYKSAAATVFYAGSLQPYYPCGLVWGADMQLAWTSTPGMIDGCYKPPGEQWYMNWRATCPSANYTCGQTFYIPRG